MSRTWAEFRASEAASLDRTVGPRLTIDELVESISEVSTLPHIAMKVMNVANDRRTGAAELRAIVEADPTLSSRVFKCVNSAQYGLGQTVTDLQRAIVLLGFNQVRNLAVTASEADVFRSNEAIGPYRRGMLWRHLVATAICARMIAVRRQMEQFEEVFLAGLLHDFGVILEDQYCHQHFAVMLHALKPDDRLIAREQEYLGFDHTVLGYRIGKRWQFPDGVLRAIRYHHAAEECGGDHAPVVACVALANFICTMSGRSSVGLGLLDVPHAAVAALSMKRDDVTVIAEDLEEELDRNRPLFSL